MTDPWPTLTRELDRWAAAGRRATFWLRDDDAVQPTPALDRLLALSARHGVPPALAVIPALTDTRLADRLETGPNVRVVQHGWQHVNHAPASEKKQEFGAHRPLGVMLEEIARGRRRLAGLHGKRFVPVFVPPWNRIDSALAARLPETGITWLSAFGHKAMPGIRAVNTGIDVMDWHGTRGGRPHDALVGEIVSELTRLFDTGRGAAGVLTHHLVHDETVWSFLDRLFALTTAHPGCAWLSIEALASATPREIGDVGA